MPESLNTTTTWNGFDLKYFFSCILLLYLMKLIHNQLWWEVKLTDFFFLISFYIVSVNNKTNKIFNKTKIIKMCYLNHLNLFFSPL